MQHPYHLLNKETVAIIRNSAAQAEREGRLTDSQLNIIYQNKWFNLFVPKEYGGLELSLPEALHLEEAFAWADGSFGWTITLCGGANWFIGFLPAQARDEIFTNNKTCLAGSGRPSGIAKLTGSGYEVSGQWDFATGAAHATIFTANCVIENDNATIKSFWFTKEEVVLQRNWKSTGMNATSSDSFEVNNLQVPAHRAFVIDPANAQLKHSIYQFPFLAFAECTLAVNTSGMTLHFLELVEKTISENEKADKQVFYPGNPKTTILLKDLLKNNTEVLETKRAYFYNVISEAWEALKIKSMLTEDLQHAVANASRDLTFTALQITDEVYPYAGLIAADPSTELNRVWRDLHTASQHTLLRFTM